MGWFSKITSVVKKAALAPLTVTKLQARVAGRLLTAASKVAPSATIFGSGARAAPAPAPVSSWRGAAIPSPMNWPQVSAPAPSPSSWLSTAAAALNPTTPILPVAAAAVPYGGPAPAPYAPTPYQPTPYQPTYQPPPSSSGGGEVYTGNAYDPDAPPADGYGMTAEDDRQDDASLYDGGELGDATAIDYERHFSGAAGLQGWSDNLLSLAKGAASGALTSGAAILTKPTAEQLAIAKAAADAKAKAAAASAGGISPTTLAVGAGVLLVGGVLLMRKRGAPAAAVAPNPGRRRRRSRR